MNLWLIKGALFFVPFQFFFIFFARKLWPERKRIFLVYGLFWAFVALLNLPMIISLIKNATYSSRNLIEWTPLDTSLWRSLETLFWFFFNPIHQSITTLGFVASLLVFFSLFHFRKWNDLAKKLLYYYAAVLFFAQFVIYSSWFIFFWQSLPISGFRLYKIIVIGPFVLFVMAMINIVGFIEFLRGSPRKVFLLVCVTAAIPCLCHFIRNPFPANFIESFIVLFFAATTILFLIILRKKGVGAKAYVLLFMALIFSERIVQANLTRPLDVHPPSFTHFYSSELFDRFRPGNKYDYRIAFINQHPVVGLYNNHQVAGGIGQYSKRYYYFWDAVITGDDDSKAFHDYYHMAYLYADKVKREESPALKINPPGFSTDLLALHNVRYIFSFNEIENPRDRGLSLVHEGRPPERQSGLKRWFQIWKRIFEPIPYYVYEVCQVAPRVFTANSYELVDGKDRLKERLRGLSVTTLRNRVVYDRKDLSQEDLELLSRLQNQAVVDVRKQNPTILSPQITRYSDNRIVVRAHAAMPQQLVLNENYFRDWTAKINGIPVTILPAYGVFRSVVLDKGQNEVVFEYRPPYLLTSLWLSGPGSVIVLAACLGWAMAGRPASGEDVHPSTGSG
jgi:hypothetical protein